MLLAGMTDAQTAQDIDAHRRSRNTRCRAITASRGRQAPAASSTAAYRKIPWRLDRPELAEFGLIAYGRHLTNCRW
jgi:hypothetical protein